MILPNRMEVIAQMKKAVEEGDFHRKVECNDAVLEMKERERLLSRYVDKQKMASYRLKTQSANALVDASARKINRNTVIVGLQNLPKQVGGAIITSNHFSPVDTTIPRMLMQYLKPKDKELFIISQDTNFVMKGYLGFLASYANTIPISSAHRYMRTYFEPRVKSLLDNGDILLIYPEEEMWFHYRKPRPPKRGAYYYAAKNHVPIISCFVELRESKEWDKEPFRKLDYVLHVLPAIYPSDKNDIQEESRRMAEVDYRQKVNAYEHAYRKRLSYDFENWDIAGYLHN